MNPIRWPAWALVVFGVVAVAAGVLGVTHAPPAAGKATLAVVAALGVIAIVWAIVRSRAAAASRR